MYVRFLIVVLVNPLFVFKTFRHLFVCDLPAGGAQTKSNCFLLVWVPRAKGPYTGCFIDPRGPHEAQGRGMGPCDEQNELQYPRPPAPTAPRHDQDLPAAAPTNLFVINLPGLNALFYNMLCASGVRMHCSTILWASWLPALCVFTIIWASR